MREIFDVMKKKGDAVTLGNLKVSPFRCDRGVRVKINRDIRRPKGWPPLGKDTVTTATKVKSLIEDNC